jgi:MFS family permease
MTVPIWVTGTVFQLGLSWTSDKLQDRRWHTVGLFCLGAFACIVSAFVKAVVAKYIMMCLLVAGLYTGLPLMLNWTSECIPFPDQKRSVAIAFVNCFGHLAIIYGALLAVAAPYLFKLLPKEPATKTEREIWALQARPEEME